MRQPVADPPGGLTARDPRVAVTYQNDFTHVLALDLINDVLYVGLLTSRHTLPLSETGQRQRVDAMAGRTVAERPDDRSGNTFDTRPSCSAGPVPVRTRSSCP
jgi:hypothetical protein